MCSGACKSPLLGDPVRYGVCTTYCVGRWTLDLGLGPWTWKLDRDLVLKGESDLRNFNGKYVNCAVIAQASHIGRSAFVHGGKDGWRAQGQVTLSAACYHMVLYTCFYEQIKHVLRKPQLSLVQPEQQNYTPLNCMSEHEMIFARRGCHNPHFDHALICSRDNLGPIWREVNRADAIVTSFSVGHRIDQS